MSIELTGPAGTMRVDESGCISFARNGRELLQSAGTTAFAEAYGFELPIVSLVRTIETAGSVFLTFSTIRPDIVLSLEARPESAGFMLRWSAPAPIPAIGLNWSLDPGRPWYGQGERVIQHWPLDRAPVNSDPFEPNDHGADGTLNIVTPFWFNAAGAALLIDQEEGELAVSLDQGGNGKLRLVSRAPVRYDTFGTAPRRVPGPSLTLHVFLAAHGPAVFRSALPQLMRPTQAPPEELMTRPIWTTWAVYKEHVTQADVETFAETIIAQGYPAAGIAIDDRWQRNYGACTWDAEKFPDPQAMIQRLQALGLQVTLWVPPFFHPDDPAFADAAARGFLVRHPATDAPYLVRWWQGYGGLIDITNPDARDWWLQRLRWLQTEYGVAGFKFDAGEASFVPHDAVFSTPIPRWLYTDLYVDWIATQFPYTEVRAGWRSQDQGILFREWDKWSRWGLDNGLHSVLTQALALSVCGYPFILPDMIGGNAYGGEEPDAELLIRWTQLSALMPAMQFSIPPWQLGDEANTICRRYAQLYTELAPYRQEIIQVTLRDGSPLVRPLFWHDPHDRIAQQCDSQFLLGERLLVAPVLQPGGRERDVYLPAGIWRDRWSGQEHKGPTWLRSVPAPLEVLPLYERID
jgi:hypothetical protein